MNRSHQPRAPTSSAMPKFERNHNKLSKDTTAYEELEAREME